MRKLLYLLTVLFFLTIGASAQVIISPATGGSFSTSTAHSWSATQTFTDITISGTCTGCVAAGSVTASGTLTLNNLVIGQGASTVATTSTAAGILTFVATPSSANLLAALTDETGTGVAVFGTTPTFTTSILIGAAGTSLTTDNDGRLTIAGLGNTNPESIRLDLDTTSNVATLTSASGVTSLLASAIAYHSTMNGASTVNFIARNTDPSGRSFVEMYGSNSATMLQINSGNSSNPSWITTTAVTGMYIRAEAANTILLFATSNTDRWRMNTTGHFTPEVTGTYDIGSTSLFSRIAYLNGVELGTTGVSITQDADGQTCWLGKSAGSDEDICFNVGDDNASNTAAILSTTGVTTINFTGMGATFNGTTTINGQYYSPTIDDGNSSTADTIDWNGGNLHYSTLTGNVTYTFSNPLNGGRYVLLMNTGAGGFTVTWPAAVLWPGGVAPTITATAGKVDMCVFAYETVNSKYYGACSQNY